MKNKILFVLLSCMLSVSCQETLEERCERESLEYTANKCPAQIGANIVLDSIKFEKSTRTLSYCYTLLNEADRNSTNAEEHSIRSSLLDELRNSTSTRAYKEAGFNFTYRYFSVSQKGKILYDFTFTKNDYNK